VTGEYEAVPIDDAGTVGMPRQQGERLELEAAIAVFQQAESINGGRRGAPWPRRRAERTSPCHSPSEVRLSMFHEGELS
jgi:hypothetical protein